MCGIYATNLPVTEDQVLKKLSIIKFRGPDFTGLCRVNDLFFGHLRLAIVDLDSRSNQPMTFENLTIVYNGEIYNFLEIKIELQEKGYRFVTSGDTEVILYAYKEWGKDLLHKLNGMFAFVIYDKINNAIFVARDRLGVKPLYYTWDNGMFEICSQLRPLASNKSINDNAVSMYIDCGYIPSPHSIFQGVHKLQPGHFIMLDLNNSNLSVNKYWDLSKVSASKISYSEAKFQLHNLLKDSVRIRLNSDVPFGTFLSGGIDSALITSIASNISIEPIRSFCIGFEDKNSDESYVASEYARILGTNHSTTICKIEDIQLLLPKLVEVYDEPFGDSSALPSLLLNKITKKYVTMAISGDGGDESFLGYKHFDLLRKFYFLYLCPFFIRKFVSLFLYCNVLGKRTGPIRRILRTKSMFEFIRGIFLGNNSLLLNRNLEWFTNFGSFYYLSDHYLQKAADLNIKLWLENDSNVKVDRASMAYSVEVRSPFLDYRLIEFARTLPVGFRYMFGKKKRILRDILKEYIPEYVFDKPKKGFSIPIGSWIRSDLKDEFQTNLKDEFLLKIPNFNVQKFKRMFDDHLMGKNDYSTHIWRVYILSRWYQEFGFYKREDN